MSQESLILLNECPQASQRKPSRIQFITRTSFESIFPNKEVPIYLPDSESFRLSLSPKNKEIHQTRKPVFKHCFYKEDFQQQRGEEEDDEERYSYESYDPDDPDFVINEEDDPNYEASEDESPTDDDYSEENILEEAESLVSGVDDESEVHFKTEDRQTEEGEEEIEDIGVKELEHQEKLFIDRKRGRALLNLPELNKRKRYRLYQDWRILKAVDFYVARHGSSILKNEDFWENLKDPMTGDWLLRSTRYSSSIFERYKRRLRYIREDTKERIYKLVEGLTKQEMLDCYCKFCTNGGGNVCFVGVQKVDEKVRYLLREAPQDRTKTRRSMRQVRNNLVIPNHGYGTRAAKHNRRVHLCYETDSSFTGGSADVSEVSKEEEIVSDYSEESSESELMSENVLNLAAASQPVYHAEESDFWISPSLPKRTVRYGTSQPLIEEEEYSRDFISRKRLVRMRERSSSFEIMNKKRKAYVDLDDDEELPLQKKIRTENIQNAQNIANRSPRKPRIDEEEYRQISSQKDKELSVLMLCVDSDSDKKKDSKLLKVSQNYPSHFLNSLLEFRGEPTNREDFEKHLESQGYQILRNQES